MNREILLADDEATFRETFAKILREEGMSVTAVGNGTDAIDAVMKQPFGVVVLDIRMPGADGIKVLREIMRIRPETRVIMITAYGTIEMAVEAIKLGACDYVMKPDMGTLRTVPWLEGTVMILCDVLDHHTHEPILASHAFNKF